MNRIFLSLFLTFILACQQNEIINDNPQNQIDCPIGFVCTGGCKKGIDDPNRWTSGCEAYYYFEGNSTIYAESVRLAFEEWENALGIHFIEAVNPTNPNIFIRIEFHEYSQLELEGFWLQYPNCKGEKKEPLGSTSPNSNTIWLNKKANWNGNNLDSGCKPIDLKPATLHEVGHVLGLGHSDNVDDIMYCSYEDQLNLSDDDILRAKTILGLNCREKFKRTEGSFPWNTSCFDCECQSAFGDDYKIADWEEVKSFISTEGYNSFFEMANMSGYRSNGWVTVNGQHLWSSNRHYFIERHDGNVPGG